MGRGCCYSADYGCYHFMPSKLQYWTHELVAQNEQQSTYSLIPMSPTSAQGFTINENVLCDINEISGTRLQIMVRNMPVRRSKRRIIFNGNNFENEHVTFRSAAPPKLGQGQGQTAYYITTKCPPRYFTSVSTGRTSSSSSRSRANYFFRRIGVLLWLLWTTSSGAFTWAQTS